MKRMRLLSWNVNGLRAIHKKGFLDWLMSEHPNVLCLQETKAGEAQVPPELRNVRGYHAYFSSPRRRGYSGVALYTRAEPETVEFSFGIERFDMEGRTIVADYGEFMLLNVYFPNGGASEERLRFKLDFYNAFLDYVDGLVSENRRIVICGDVNTAHKEIDLARPKQNVNTSGFLPEERAWLTDLMNHGFVDTFRMFNKEPGQYTWWDMKTRARGRNVGWRIDYFLVSNDLKPNVKAAYIMPDVMGSDHCPVGLDLVRPAPKDSSR
jgi:exodeoxyribonuclease-3